MSRYKELKERAWLANMEIPKQELALYTWGNVSEIDRDLGVFAIKPSGVPYDALKAEDLVVLDLTGERVEGKLRASSDMKTHLVLYQRFEAIGGITHTHSTFAVGWAQAGLAVPIYGTTHADHTHLSIPSTPIMGRERVEGDYELETGYLVADLFEGKNPVEQPMVLVAGHGPFAWGKDGMESVYNAVVLEEICKMAYITRTLNPHAEQLPSYLNEKHYMRKHGPGAYYGQS
jgi:L-ribulose-5-phosphate 4-epimerase